MRKVTVTCDHCGFKKTFNEDEFEPTKLKGWAFIHVRGPYEDIEVCPECLKSFLGVAELKEVKEDD